MFSREPSRALSDHHVAVRITGGDDLSPEANEFMTEYAVTGYPTLLVMNADGHVVVDRVPRTLEGMLDALELGAQREVEFAALARATDVTSRIEHAKMLCDRMQMDAAEQAFHAILAESPGPDAHAGLAKLYDMRGDRAKERKLLTRMLEMYPDAAARTSWAIRLATMDLEAARSRDAWREKLAVAVERLQALHETTDRSAGGDVLPRAEVRTTLARYLSISGRNQEAEAHLDWVLEHAGTTRFAPAALLGLANVRWRQGEYAACKAAFERILAEFPESDAARIAPRGIRNCDARLGK